MKRFLKWLTKVFNNFWVRLCFLLACVIVILWAGGMLTSGEKTVEFLTSGDVLSVFLAAVISLIVASIVLGSRNYLEDSNKTEDDHHKIICLYKDHSKEPPAKDKNFFDKDGVYACLTCVPSERKAKNPEKDKYSDAYATRQKNCDEYVEDGKLYLPSISVFTNITGNVKVRFMDNISKYELPPFLTDNALKLLAAHSTSNTGNGSTIRLDDVDYSADILTLSTCRSQYFDMLITNRCMDYKIDDGVSVRDVYECGTKVSPLDESKLGNQIGINGLIITRDRYILTEKRGRHKTTWKNKFAQPISLAFKTKDVLPDGGTIDDTPQDAENCFKKVILKTLKNNFGLAESDITGFSAKNFFGIARDLLEGGKPNLYFYVTVDMTAAEFCEFLSDKYRAASVKDQRKNPLPKIPDEKMDSEYYLIKVDDIRIDYNYELGIKTRDVYRVKRKFYPRFSKAAARAECNAFYSKRRRNGTIKRECGEAFLVCLYYYKQCEQRIKNELDELSRSREVN